MLPALRTLLLGLMLWPVILTAQMGGGCTGETFAHFFRDDTGADVRVSSIIRYTGASGDLLLGGTVGGDLFFSRISSTGELRWRRTISRPSLSTELSTIGEVIIDRQGMIAAVGSVFNDPNLQQAFLLRYDPLADRVLYLRVADFSSQGTGIKLTSNDEYLVSGSRFGTPAPVFNSALLMRVDPQTGLEASPSLRYDHLGDEGFIDVLQTPSGELYAGGNISGVGRSRDARAGISRLNPDGTPLWTRSGPASGSVTARLLSFDVEVVNDVVYVLHWGNIGIITGSTNTSMLLAAFTTGGTELWTRRYDVTNYSGEEAVELVPYRGGLLAYGFRLIGKRDPFLIQLDAAGQVVWARAYEPPGNATIYLRANQQLLADSFGISILGSYGFSEGRAREGMLLQLDEFGNTDNPCLSTLDLNVAVSNLSAVWETIPLQVTEQAEDWSSRSSASSPTAITVFDDCDVSCEDCSIRTFGRTAICRGDSVFIGSRWRAIAGVYADTTAGLIPGCDSIQQLELAVSDGPEARYRVVRRCGLRTAEVRVDVSGGEFPYRYTWSDPRANGPLANLLPGNYRLTVNDALGCNPAILEVDVEDTGGGGIDFSVVPPTCPGGNDGRIVLTPPGSGSLKLLPDGPFRPNVADSLTAGNYQFVLRDSTGCEVFRQVTLPEAAPVGVEVVGPTVVRLGDELSLTTAPTSSTGLSTYRWSSVDSLNCADCPTVRLQPLASGTVYLEATTAAGCVATDSLSILVSDSAPRLYLPTAFSPNGDGVNDVWRPGLGPEVARILDVEIFDRWGNLVHTLTNGSGWAGQDAAPAAYVYHLKAALINGRVIDRRGEVVLVR